MFLSTEWKLHDEIEENVEEKSRILAKVESPDGKLIIEILHRFDFESKLQRMSAICKIDRKIFSFVKGSPEKLVELCKKNTIPENFD